MNIENEEKSKLSVGKYTVDLDTGGCDIYKVHDEGHKTFVCGGIAEPQIAMEIIEGLIMVEYKRFYYPESQPTFEQGPPVVQETVVPFLKNLKGDSF